MLESFPDPPDFLRGAKWSKLKVPKRKRRHFSSVIFNEFILKMAKCATCGAFGPPNATPSYPTTLI